MKIIQKSLQKKISKIASDQITGNKKSMKKRPSHCLDGTVDAVNIDIICMFNYRLRICHQRPQTELKKIAIK